MFPSSFDPEIYRIYEDIKDFSLEQLLEHYEKYGKSEGRVSSEIRGKNDLLSLLDKERTLTLTNNCYIEDIKYKFVVNDHNITYETDLITHLEKIYDIVEEGGYYILVIPDKRYGSGYFIPETTIANVLEDYYEKKGINPIKHLVEHRCYTTHNDPKMHWENNHGERKMDENSFFLKYTLNEYLEKIEEPLTNSNYHFTPDSFKQVVMQLVFLKLINFNIEVIYPTLRESNEFFIVLKK